MKTIVTPISIAAFTCLILSFTWIGFLASDDQLYLLAVEGWLNDFPFAGATHWAVRHTVVLPMVVSVSLFGSNEFALALPTILYFFGVLGLAYWVTRYVFLDTVTAAVVTLLLAVTPLFAVQSTIAGVDIPELFFVVLSLWLFYRAAADERTVLLLFLAGIAAGLAWMSRETSAALLIFYGLLFLRGKGLPRRLYWVMAGGWFLVTGLESLYFFLTTGDVLHRLNTVLSSHTSLGNVLKLNYAGGTGNVVHNRVFGPPLSLLLNQEFGLIFYMAIPAGIAACFGPGLNPEQRRFVRLLAGLGVVWFFVVGYMLGLRALPRYFTVPTFVAVFLIGIWLSQILRHRSLRLACLLAAGLVAVNIAGILVENRDPLFGERVLARFAGEADEAVYTDPHTLYRSGQFLRWTGEEAVARARVAPAPEGGLFLYYPKNVVKGYVPGQGAFDPDLFRPDAQWQEVWRADPPERLVGIIARIGWVQAILPGAVVQKLLSPNPPVVVYRTGAP